MTDPELAERLARIQQRRAASGSVAQRPTRSSTTAAPAARAVRRRPKHPALGSRIAAAGLGLSATFGMVTAMHLADAADVGAATDTGNNGQATTSTTGTGAAPAAVLPVAAGSTSPPVVRLTSSGTTAGSTSPPVVRLSSSGTTAGSTAAATTTTTTRQTVTQAPASTAPTTSSTHGSR